MAIKINIELNTGIKADNVYCRIERVSCFKEICTFKIRKYVSSDKPFFSEESITAPYTLDGANPFVQAYEYIKSLPEYANAEDC